MAPEWPDMAFPRPLGAPPPVAMVTTSTFDDVGRLGVRHAVGDGPGGRDRWVVGRVDGAGCPAWRSEAFMTATGKRVFFIRVTALFPDVDHAVTDEEMAARNVEGRGEYRALCTAVFLPAPDDRPPGQPCPACEKTLREKQTPPTAKQRHRGQRGRVMNALTSCRAPGSLNSRSTRGRDP